MCPVYHFYSRNLGYGVGVSELKVFERERNRK
jgi:hypothetical protein